MQSSIVKLFVRFMEDSISLCSYKVRAATYQGPLALLAPAARGGGFLSTLFFSSKFVFDVQLCYFLALLFS